MTFAKEEMTKNGAIEKICGESAEYAKVVMKGRQIGLPIIDAIKIVNKIESIAVRDYYKSIVYDAYKEPKWSTEEYKINAEIEFSNEVYLTCVNTFQETLKDY